MDVASEIRKAVETGKVILGAKQTLKALKIGKAKAVIIAKNCPDTIKKDVAYYAKLAGTPLYVFEGDNKALGTVCGKPFSVSTMAVLSPGESKILEILNSLAGGSQREEKT